ncbi:MAG: WD40 repeat domain-containing protein [Kofleriaceae bacterium]
MARTAARCRANGDEAYRERFIDLAKALGRESHWLRAAPEAMAGLVWNRLRRNGWTASDLDAQLRVPSSADMLRVRHAATRESPTLVRSLEGHTALVRACAVTQDGRYVVSASYDQTLKVWELASGRALATLEGHTARVTACAVTPDGRHVVSASNDKTLKVWELASGRALATLAGHTDAVTACAVTPNGRHVVSASADKTLMVWELASRRALATLEGHAEPVTACAVTPDGRHVVSASYDHTLKVWDLATYTCRSTHRGDAAYLAVAITATAIVAGDAAGAVWFLDMPRYLASAIDAGAAPESPVSPMISPIAVPVAAPAVDPSPTVDRGIVTIRSTQSPPRTFSPSAAQPPTPMPRSPMTANTILFMAANPAGTDARALAEQARAIQGELERTGHRDRFVFETRWAAQPLDLLRDMVKLKPTVVHFCGGRLSGSSGSAPAAGVYFQGPDGRAQLVSGEALARVFDAVGAVKLVVLDACYSEPHADAIAAHVDCVVGMTGGIVDQAATSFSIGLYGGLGEGESIAAAFKQGRAAIGMTGIGDPGQPQLRVRHGVDARRLVLADPR